MQLRDLGHHVFVDGQAARSIDNQHVAELDPRMGQRRLHNVDRLLLDITGKEVHAHFSGQGLQLFDSGRAVDIGTDDRHLFLVALLQQFGQLGDGGCFTRTLQPRHHDHGRRRRREVQPLVGRTHHRFQFGLYDLQEGLARAQALHDVLAQRALFHRLHEILDHRQRDIGFQQRHAHFTHGLLDIVLR